MVGFGRFSRRIALVCLLLLLLKGRMPVNSRFVFFFLQILIPLQGIRRRTPKDQSTVAASAIKNVRNFNFVSVFLPAFPSFFELISISRIFCAGFGEPSEISETDESEDEEGAPNPRRICREIGNGVKLPPSKSPKKREWSPLECRHASVLFSIHASLVTHHPSLITHHSSS